MTLTEFLLARIAEDEAAINGADFRANVHDAPVVFTEARMLAECEAKRQIIAEHEPQGGVYGRVECGTCFSTVVGAENTALGVEYVSMERWPCPTLRSLALPYADHPDYDPEWRP